MYVWVLYCAVVLVMCVLVFTMFRIVCIVFFVLFRLCIFILICFVCTDGFGGLVVSMLASGTQVCGFKPGRSRWIFAGVKILTMPSAGGEVKESVPCPRFAACKGT